MGNIGFSGMRELGLALRDAMGLGTFVETGTYKAEATRWAAENFARVVTVEAYAPYYSRAVAVCADYTNIEPVFGNSAERLGSVLAGVDGPALVWLDAHWMSSMDISSNFAGGECPLRAELAALRKDGRPHAILIDDARLFTTPPAGRHDPAQWPRFPEVRAALPVNYYVTIWRDAIIAVPPQFASVVRHFTGESDGLHVAVLTSNDYIGMLPGFEYLFDKYWPGQAAEIVRYEVKPPKLYPQFSNFAIGPQSEYTWSGGLARYLDCTAHDRVVLLLEDYYLTRPVDAAAVRRAWDLLGSSPELAKVDLSGDLQKREYAQYAPGFVQAHASARFQASLQAAVWRVSSLRAILSPDETPWQFEKHGTRRLITLRKDGGAGTVAGLERPALDYINACGGEGHNPGQYDRRKFSPELWAELSGRGLVK